MERRCNRAPTGTHDNRQLTRICQLPWAHVAGSRMDAAALRSLRRGGARTGRDLRGDGHACADRRRRGAWRPGTGVLGAELIERRANGERRAGQRVYRNRGGAAEGGPGRGGHPRAAYGLAGDKWPVDSRSGSSRARPGRQLRAWQLAGRRDGIAGWAAMAHRGAARVRLAPRAGPVAAGRSTRAPWAVDRSRRRRRRPRGAPGLRRP